MSHQRSMESDVLLRVVIPVHNGRRYLRSTLESVVADLPENAEILIVDDGSTDDSVSIVHSLKNERMILCRNATPRGISNAINRGVFHEPHREFVAIVEHDDIVLPGRFAHQLEALTEHERLGVVGSRGRYTDDAGRILGHVSVGPTSLSEFQEAADAGEVLLTPHACAMYRFSALAAAGGYDPQFDGAQDIDVMNRIVFDHGYQLLTLEQPSFLYRLHSTATSFATFRFQRAAARYVKYRNRARRAEIEPIPMAVWLANEERLLRTRLRWWRHDRGALYLRRAALLAMHRRPARAGLFAAAAALLHPAWVSRKIRNQVRCMAGRINGR